jgi:hypothetical protein
MGLRWVSEIPFSILEIKTSFPASILILQSISPKRVPIYFLKERYKKVREYLEKL